MCTGNYCLCVMSYDNLARLVLIVTNPRPHVATSVIKVMSLFVLIC